MNIKLILSGVVSLSLCACTLAPGPFLDNARLDRSQPTQTVADKYVVKPIDIAYFAEERAAALPSVCPLICLTSETRKTYQYFVGINDQLTIIVWDHPELTGGAVTAGILPPLPQGSAGTTPQGGAPALGSPSTTSSEGGLTVRVANDGTIFFPRVGRIKAAGKTAEEIQVLLRERLRKTIVDPQIDVRVSGFNSQIVQITGNVKLPNAESITDMPLSVLDAINRAGGAQPDADLQDVGVTRNGIRYRVDVAALLETGDPQQNVLLRDGDIIDVPDRSNSRVFVLGEVARPTSLPMNRGKLTLADALTGAGSLDVRTGDPRQIYVIRGAENMVRPASASVQAGMMPVKATTTAPMMPSVFVLDMTQVDALMLMTKFQLQPRDVVYVQVAASARFNRLLEQLTPTIQTLFFTKELGR